MNKTVITVVSMAIAMVATPLLANDLSGNGAYHPPEGFKIRYISSLKFGERSEIVRRASDEYLRQLHVQIAADSTVVDELRSHHVSIKSVIGSRSTMSGTTVYYVK
ncbi:hypothetical protein [Rhizobium sp. LjRoot254]|uniref:hypothetical protein n=1 Tax=Rhizobium sp. LjRoot254 TaxID=3342297 RepID=UPI003ED13945